MRAKSHIAQLEARLHTLEEAVAQFQELSGQAAATSCANHSAELSALGDLKSYVGRQLAIQSDRLATLSLRLDMTHSRVERLDRIQDEIHQTQEEHTEVLTEILDRIRVKN